MKVEKKLDPASLVARIIAELQVNPDAQQQLLRALLTNEFLGVPARLDRIEKDVAELKVDVAQLKTDVAELKTDMAALKTDVAALKGSDLENRLHRKIRALMSQAFKLRSTRVVQGPVQEPKGEFLDEIENAVRDGRMTEEQESRIDATDFILSAKRRSDPTPVWIAVEASNTVHSGDINRVRASADALQAALHGDALAVVAGYDIDAANAERAEAAGVTYLQVSPPRSR